MKKLLFILMFLVFASKAVAIPLDYEVSWDDDQISNISAYLQENLPIFNSFDFSAFSIVPGTNDFVPVDIFHEGVLWLTLAIPSNIVMPSLGEGQPSVFSEPVPSAPVPEPATLVLLGAGMLTLTIVGRKKMAAAKA